MESLYAGGMASRIEKEASRVETEPAAGEFYDKGASPLFCKRELKPLSRTGLLYQLQLSSRMCQAKRLFEYR